MAMIRKEAKDRKEYIVKGSKMKKINLIVIILKKIQIKFTNLNFKECIK